MCGLKRLTAEELAIDIEREPAHAKRTLEVLVKAGLAQTHGIKHGRTYTLTAGVYQAERGNAAFTRQMDFSSLQHEQPVLSYARQHGAIRRAEVIELCRLSEGQAKALLKRMKMNELLRLEGAGCPASCRLGPKV